ncbi:hypothetical protein LRP67_08375 [Nocardioides sp. cx-169]|uniref:hypothetical protein n=1 Tax=Nocardioides sp. cx-169 TaxID=2899080 RepID=UPI001E36D191|nr:hypothetical protein [Nocardioides sp. cx-169]MCD4534092.1 hypothetical protein [Nocardioides sp. cx-169]
MIDELERSYRRLPRGGTLLAILIAAHVLLKLALLPKVGHTPFVGDEAYYVDGGRALSNLVRDLVSLGPVDTAELERNVVGSGWFMPGMSVLLTPLFLVDPDASTFVIRCYLGVVSTVVLLLAVRTVRRTFGDRYAAILLVFPGLVPMYLLFMYAAWGDLLAGLLVVMLVAHVVTIFRQVRQGVAFTLREGAWLGLVGITIVYLRSSTALLVGGLMLVMLASLVVLLRRRERLRGITAMALAGVLFVGLLLPWSVAASQSLGGRVLTTTSVPTVLANTFGEYDRICFGPCDPGSTIWFSPLRYAREVARATDGDQVAIQSEMSSYARQGVTPQSYSRDVLGNFYAYALEPSGYNDQLMDPDTDGDTFTYWFVTLVTALMWYLSLIVLVWVLLLATRRSFDSQILSIVLKLSLGALLTQPFIHLASARYWPTAAPLLALALGLWLQVRAERRVAVGVGHDLPALEQAVGTPSPAAVHRAFYWVQLGLAVASVTVAVGVVVVALWPW